MRFVPYEKMSKKAQKAANAKHRGSWNGINLVTRVPVNSRAYQRQKATQAARREANSLGSSFWGTLYVKKDIDA